MILPSLLTFLFFSSSDPIPVVIGYGIGCCAGIGLFFYGLRLAKRRRRILDTPFSEIRSAAADMAQPFAAENWPDDVAALQPVAALARPAGATSHGNPSHVTTSHVTPSHVTPYEVIRLTPENSPPLYEMSQQQKVAAALMKAGISNPAAWRSAPLTDPAPQGTADASATFSAVSGNGGNGPGSNLAAEGNNGFDPHSPVVFTKGSNDKTFLISWPSQPQAARSFEWKVALLLWGGPALALLCLYLIFRAEHLL